MGCAARSRYKQGEHGRDPLGCMGVLLDAGAQPDRPQSKDGMTPILLALKVKDYDRVFLLAKRGADPTQADGKGETPLSLLGPAGLEAALAAAAEGGRPQAAATLERALVEMGAAEPSSVPLWVAAKCYVQRGVLRDVVEATLRARADAALEVDQQGDNALHCALKHAHKPAEALELVDQLVTSCPAACEAQDAAGNLPLHVAVSQGPDEVKVKSPAEVEHSGLPAGTRICVPDRGEGVYVSFTRKRIGRNKHQVRFGDEELDIKWTDECSVVQGANASVVERVLRAFPGGCTVQNNDSKYPLECAVESKVPTEILEMLREASDLDEAIAQALCCAIRNEQWDMVSTLRPTAAACKAKNADGKCLLECAVESKVPTEILEMLREASDSDEAIAQALQCAIRNEQWDMVSTLRPTAAACKAKNADGKYPLLMAIDKEAENSIIESLIRPLESESGIDTVLYKEDGRTCKIILRGAALKRLRDLAETYGIFMGLYLLGDTVVHISATCVVIFAEDKKTNKMVALKFMANKEEWLREQEMRT
eukprot:COSAG02_NODE_7768_length_2855_cov_18.922714_2_plen_538_part_01